MKIIKNFTFNSNSNTVILEKQVGQLLSYNFQHCYFFGTVYEASVRSVDLLALWERLRLEFTFEINCSHKTLIKSAMID